MSQRTRALGLCGVAALLAVAGLLWRSSTSLRLTSAVVGVPPVAQESAQAALAQAGYATTSAPVWAGAEAAWQAPGHYRLFFAAPAAEGGADVYSAEAQVGPDGRVARLAPVTPLVQTPAGDEGAPVAADGWLAFATQVAGRYQSITCVALSDLGARQVYAFAQPAESVALGWQGTFGDAGLRLTVDALQGGQRTALSVDPALQQVAPDAAALQYMPAAKGEQAWLPNLVSRVRELPGVGPEKIAFLENVFFTVVDWATRLTQGAPAPQATLPPTPTREVTTAAPEPSETVETAGPPPEATSTAPTATPAGQRLADGIVWRGSVAPDAARPYAKVEVVEIDPSLLQIKMVPGTIEPKPSTGLVGSGVIPPEDWGALVAAFNGGFAAMHGQFGMMVDRKVYLPARDGVATMAVYEDGSIRLGTWGRDLTQTPDMVSYRQNCPPLIEDGTITAETGKLTLWGLSVSDEVYLYRSGLGVTRDGRLVYVCGRSLSAYTLARALQMAGACYGMQLDVDEYHVAFISYDVQQAESGLVVTGQKLLDNMHGFDTYFLQPFQLDFFYLLRRPEPLAGAVRMAPAVPTVTSAAESLAEPLPGRLAFASNREGSWDLYTMTPGRPDSVRRLVGDAADDLYPAWSRDGQQVAFASRRDGNLEIYVADAATGTAHRVTDSPAEEWAPCWSPDGARLAYQTDRNGQSDVYVCAPDGSGETRLTPMTGNHEAPDWSPDGTRIVFDSDQDTANQVAASISLYLMNADGSEHRRLLAHAESPRWSPDGQHIAFTSRSAGVWQVYVINADGSGLRQVTNGARDARYPSWSPDGRWLAYSGNETGRWALYAVEVAGGASLRLSDGAGDSSFPAWGP